MEESYDWLNWKLSKIFTAVIWLMIYFARNTYLISIIIEEMDMNVKDLFTKGKANNLGKLIGKWKVKKTGSSVYVELYELGLV